MITVLVTGVGGGVGQGIIKSLRLIKDIEIKIISADMSELASGLYGGDYSYLVPAASDSHYFDEIEKICLKNKVDFYFPGTDVELIKCAKSIKELKTKLNVEIVISPLNVIEVADDKLKTAVFLKENGFSHPQTWIPEEVVWYDMVYPLIVKPKVGFRSIGVHVVYTEYEAKSAIASLDGPIIQEYIDGDEYTCTIVFGKDCVSDVLCLRRDLRAGDTFRAFPVRNYDIESYVEKIALKLGIYGSCNFQLRLTPEGVPKVFEINSRFSGTTPFCSYLGFNPVEFYLKSMLGRVYKSDIDYSKVVVRHWCEVVVDKLQLDELKANRHGKVVPEMLSTML
jgi:carbamoyl-phosphate synthase large subunit